MENFTLGQLFGFAWAAWYAHESRPLAKIRAEIERRGESTDGLPLPWHNA